MAITLGGCASTVDHPGLNQTRAMTDANGTPISPGLSGLGPVGVGIGIGSWGGGGGVGFGLGF
ncbi:hypothetical protein [Noviherbaspirillum humi]|nr:hypothetical protein [Noviherbaspirillum humi]